VKWLKEKWKSMMDCCHYEEVDFDDCNSCTTVEKWNEFYGCVSDTSEDCKKDNKFQMITVTLLKDLPIMIGCEGGQIPVCTIDYCDTYFRGFIMKWY